MNKLYKLIGINLNQNSCKLSTMDYLESYEKHFLKKLFLVSYYLKFEALFTGVLLHTTVFTKHF